MLIASSAFAQTRATNNYTNYNASAFCLQGKMANGQRVFYGAVAADTRILPLGTLIEVDNLGIFKVSDTGSAIHGNRLDIWVRKCSDAVKFGIKHVRVRIISKLGGTKHE